jgi:hypothetical protein
MRAIALAIIIGVACLEMAIKNEKWSDHPKEERILYQVIVVTFVVCLIFGV